MGENSGVEQSSRMINEGIIRVNQHLPEKFLWGEEGLAKERQASIEDSEKIHFLLATVSVCRQLGVSLPDSGVEANPHEILKSLPNEVLKRLQEKLSSQIARVNDGKKANIFTYGAISLGEKKFSGSITDNKTGEELDHRHRHGLARLHFLPTGEENMNGDQLAAAEARVALIDMANLANDMKRRKDTGKSVPKYIMTSTTYKFGHFAEKQWDFRSVNVKLTGLTDIIHDITQAVTGGVFEGPHAEKCVLIETDKLIGRLPELKETADKYGKDGREEEARRLLIEKGWPLIFDKQIEALSVRITKQDAENFKVGNLPLSERINKLESNLIAGK